MATELIDTNFDEKLNASAKALVDFWAPWCGPCRAQAPILEKLTGNFDVYKVNVDDYPDLAHRYGIKSIPALLVFEHGKLTKTAAGVHNLDQLKALLD